MILAENTDEMPKLNGHAIEKEVKLRIKHARFLGLLEKHGLKFSISKTATQRDLIFDFPDFRLFRGDQLFRIRLENGKLMLTFKGRRDISRYSKRRIEIEEDIGSERAIDVLEKIGIRVSEPPSTLEATVELLKRSGMIMVIEVVKERTLLNLEGWGCNVYLDKVRGLGEFVEIEGEGADQLVDVLDLPKAVVMESYVEMLVRSLDHELSSIS